MPLSINCKTPLIIRLFDQFPCSLGKSTGLVTTARVTHATPAPLYASAADRKWESDVDLTQGAKDEGCPDIGAQLVDGDVGSKLNVSEVHLCLKF